ncbi:MAG TPA: DUF1684 domain-containing protein [Vicinamibacterales bacterium]
MKLKSAFLSTLVIAAACTTTPPSEGEYVRRIATARAAKDTAFKNQSEPVPEHLKSSLLPLAYYPIDPKYDVAAALMPSGDDTARPMVYSDGAVRSVRKVGTLKFLLNGQEVTLSAFVEVGASDHSLFVPFADLTNRTDTYPSGRMMDVERTVNGIYDLDFNEAYNPSCYYSPTSYSCPLPPKDNQLPLAVAAGERIKAH